MTADEGKNAWNLSGVDMTIHHSQEIYDRLQIVTQAYDCEYMNCVVCKLAPLCEKKEMA